MKLIQVLRAAFLIIAITSKSSFAATDRDLDGKDALTLKRMLTAERKRVAAPAPAVVAAHHANMGAALEAYVQALEDHNFVPVVTIFKEDQKTRMIALIDELVANEGAAFLRGAAAGGAKNRGQFKTMLRNAVDAVAIGVREPTDKSLPGVVEYYANLQAEFSNAMIAWLEGLGAAANTKILVGGVRTGGLTASGFRAPVNTERDSLKDAIIARIS